MIFVKRHLSVRSDIVGFDRIDTYELPLEALREAITNAIVHRDYSMTGTSLMAVGKSLQIRDNLIMSPETRVISSRVKERDIYIKVTDPGIICANLPLSFHRKIKRPQNLRSTVFLLYAESGT